MLLSNSKNNYTNRLLFFTTNMDKILLLLISVWIFNREYPECTYFSNIDSTFQF